MLNQKYTLVIVLFFLQLATGCASTTLPPRLTDAEAKRFATAPHEYSVGVEPYQWPAYSDGLLDVLRRTHLFASVKPLDQCKTPPTLIARIENPYNDSPCMVPVLTFVTLGIIPTSVKESHGYDFSIRFADDPKRIYHVQYFYRATVTLGWFALIQSFMPNAGWGIPDLHKQFCDRFGLAIVDAMNASAGDVSSTQRHDDK